MSERRKIEERLKKKEQEVLLLQEQIKETRVYIQALQDVLKMMPKSTDPALAAESVLRAGSSVAQAREAILTKGHPLQILELLQVMGKEPNRENRASLTSSLAAYVRREEIFSRPAPNTFGLIELGHAEQEPVPPMPPAGFGALKPAISDSPTPPEKPKGLDDDIPF